MNEKEYDWRMMRGKSRLINRHEDIVIEKSDRWKQTLDLLSTHLQNGDQRAFHQLVRRMTKIKPKQGIVEGLIGEDGVNILGSEEIDKRMADYF